MPERTVRKLAAIVSTDIVGYSRLIETDEAETLARMKAHRRELWTPLIEKHGGRVVGAAGDSLLVEYSSVVSAVESTIEIQLGMAAREAERPDDNKMLLRIGVNIGEVVVDGDDIFGAGVNVAARLQTLAEPGGISISAKVHDEIAGKLNAGFSDQGEHKVKNISRPVRVWRWTGDGAPPDEPDALVTREALALPDKPSIAVLPFETFSDDADQEYFADGIAEDIITALSRLSGFFVIARNSTFIYKGKSVNVAQVARELGVRYVLNGSVRKAGNRVRLTAQLIDGIAGAHIWAEKFDGDLADVFDLQDEITHKIVSSISPELIRAEADRLRATPHKDLAAWEYMTRAITSFWRWTKSDFEEAERLMRKALQLEPDNAECLGLFCRIRWAQAMSGFVRPGRQALKEALDAGERAVGADESSARAHGALALVLMASQRYEEAVSEAERAVELAPGSAETLLHAGVVHAYAGPQERAIEQLQLSLRLNPRDPMVYARYQTMAVAHFALGEYERSLELTRRVVRVLPEWIESHTVGIACLVQLARIDEAKKEADAVLHRWPHYSTEYALRRHPYRDEQARQRLRAALLSAGLP